MTKRVLMAAGLAALLTAGSVVVIAQAPQGGPGSPGVQGHGPGRGPRGGGPRGFAGDMGLRGVDLTDAQREQVRTIMESHQTQFEQVGTKLRAAHRAFAEATHAETLDEATVRARSNDVAAAMAEEAILRARVRAEVFGILTAEQQQRAREQRAAPRQPRRQ